MADQNPTTNVEQRPMSAANMSRSIAIPRFFEAGLHRLMSG
jgi:hypothetical protein